MTKNAHRLDEGPAVYCVQVHLVDDNKLKYPVPPAAFAKFGRQFWEVHFCKWKSVNFCSHCVQYCSVVTVPLSVYLGTYSYLRYIGYGISTGSLVIGVIFGGSGPNWSKLDRGRGRDRRDRRWYLESRFVRTLRLRGLVKSGLPYIGKYDTYCLFEWEGIFIRPHES